MGGEGACGSRNLIRKEEQVYLQCPRNKDHMRHTDCCVAEHCKDLRREMVDLPHCQQEQYRCDFEAAKQRKRRAKK
jgi:hypothetical protein